MPCHPVLVSGRQHRDTGRKEKRREQVAHLTFAARNNDLILGLPFDAVVLRVFKRRPITVLLPVGFVVFHSVRNKIAEREPIVRCDILNGRKDPFAFVREEIAGPGEPIPEGAEY